MPGIRKADIVIEEIAPILPTIHESLEQGTYETKVFFESQKKERDYPFDVYLAPQLTRYFAILFLIGKWYGENDEKYKECILRHIPNNGIHISYNSYNLKVLKAKDGNVPPPGNSISRQHYYDQQIESWLPFLDFPTSIDKINLVLLWDVNGVYDLELRWSPKFGQCVKVSPWIF